MQGEGAPGAASPWLPLGASLGRVGAAFLIAANLLYLVAPLVCVVNSLTRADLVASPSEPETAVLALLGKARWFVVAGDILSALGAVLVASALPMLAWDLRGRAQAPPRDVRLLAAAASAALVAWALGTLAAFGRPAGGGLEAVGTFGGLSVATAALLAGSVLYMAFSLRAGRWSGRRRFAPLFWPVYGAVSLLGSAAIGSLVLGDSRGADAVALEVGIELTLVPLLGVVAYKGLWDGVPDWRLLAPRPVTAPVAPRAEPASAAASPPEPAWEAPAEPPTEEPSSSEGPGEDLPPPPDD